MTRSGSAYGTSCDGKLIVAGGERSISSRVDVFDGQNWQTFTNGLNDSRHGTGLAVDCVRNRIYIARYVRRNHVVQSSTMYVSNIIISYLLHSGAPSNGGGKVVKSLEIYTP